MTHEDIFNYQPPVEFLELKEQYNFTIIGAAHGHVYHMAKGLIAAGATLVAMYDADPANVATMKRMFPDVPLCESAAQIYDDPGIALVITAGIPSERAGIAIAAMEAGKDCMADKAPLISLSQLEALKAVIAKTGRKYSVFYGESHDSEAVILACDLIRRGVIGKLCYVNGAAPHRLNAPTRPEWFFHFDKTGGLLIDLLCHQVHQFLLFLDAQGLPTDVQPIASRVGNLFHREMGELQDYGDATFTARCGVSGYFRVDWLSPAGLCTWGDSRMVIGGDRGMIELRKNCDIARDGMPNHVYVVNDDGEFYENVCGKLQKPYFHRFIRESIDGYTDPYELKLQLDAIELTIRAQMAAEELPSATKGAF
ncbi:MAG: Gfo/Idh/MocA family oxidoreductase [Clostridia bacterium]|nr:Gfo/Idh/MocA family oxidoreductase [Clostridia bacterium]